MRTLRSAFPVLVVVVLVLPAAAQSPVRRATPESIGLAPAALRDASALLRQFAAEEKIAGAVAAVSRKGRVGYLEAVGVQDLQSRVPMSERTLFRIYSMTKPITAVAVMMLHDEGRFALTDPVSMFLPEFAGVRVVDAPGAPPRAPVRAITVEDLLLHTSGLSHRTSELYRALEVRSRADTLPQFIGKIARAPLLEDPHTRFRYSEATTVLGRLIEVWSGQSFDVFLQQRIFDPLGMADTSFWVRPEHASRLATVYGSKPGGGLSAVETEALPVTTRPTLLEGAVGLISSVPDYLRFAQMLLNNGELDGQRLLQAGTAERMTKNGLPDDVRKARGGPMGWGLANVNVLMDRVPGSSARVGEYGWDGTAGTIFWADPAAATIIVLMTQSVPANPDGLRQKFKSIVQGAVLEGRE
ncbi:MAG: serine hydrolase domain-containing protein [Vicinamibacterales bacterium]